MEDFARGEAELEILFAKNPDDPGVNNDLGYLYADQGKNLEKAEAMIRKAVAEEPDNYAYLDSLGWVLFKRGKFQEARGPLEKAGRPPGRRHDPRPPRRRLFPAPGARQGQGRLGAGPEVAADAKPVDKRLRRSEEARVAQAVRAVAPAQDGRQSLIRVEPTYGACGPAVAWAARSPFAEPFPDPELDGFMAGHSHSANIAAPERGRRRKRGKLFSKLCRKIYVAAKNGGGDPDMNLKLRYAIDKARSYSCPKDNIERSIKKGTGELGAENFEEVTYEGYGPGGVAVLCEVLTDNRNRTAGDLRKAFEVCGGNLGSNGCVSYLFEYKGLFVIEAKHVAEDQLMEVVLEAGADDLKRVDDYFEVTCDPKVFESVRKALEEHKIATESAETSYIPANYVALDVDNGKRMLRLRDILEENEDVQNTFDNAEVPEELLQA